MERSWPDWLILYSLGNRRFYAIATWFTPEPVVVEDDTAEGLEERMRHLAPRYGHAAVPHDRAA
ncbi:hypothetical protein [Streptosporangium carneum]|nr:hypothetical protein [Streptosporangium carneum]